MLDGYISGCNGKSKKIQINTPKVVRIKNVMYKIMLGAKVEGYTEDGKVIWDEQDRKRRFNYWKECESKKTMYRAFEGLL